VSTAGHQRIHWAAAPMVFVVVPCCPGCGDTRYTKVRTESSGDGSSVKKVICRYFVGDEERGCGQEYKIVLELPESGNAVFPLE
jgi:hypothetical protein